MVFWLRDVSLCQRLNKQLLFACVFASTEDNSEYKSHVAVRCSSFVFCCVIQQAANCLSENR